MRRTEPRDLPSEADYEDYVNPEPYLDRIIPIPQWIEECNDYFYRHLLETVDAGALNKHGAKYVIDTIERKIQEQVEKFVDMATQPPEFEFEMPTAETGFTIPTNEAEGSFMENLKSELSSFGNLFNVDR